MNSATKWIKKKEEKKRTESERIADKQIPSYKGRNPRGPKNNSEEKIFRGKRGKTGGIKPRTVKSTQDGRDLRNNGKPRAERPNERYRSLKLKN